MESISKLQNQQQHSTSCPSASLLLRSYASYKDGTDKINTADNLGRVLVLGAGGLGCEILQELPLLGFHTIDVIDMDTIELSNLNRQALFSPADIGCPKAQIAAAKAQKRFPNAKITPHVCRLQDKDASFYSQFNVIVSGLDSVAARRWINALLLQIIDPTKPETTKVFVDGGSEGLRGQVRVIIPHITACFECTMDLHVPRKSYPICTIANTPRLPEHCIEWAALLEWPKEDPFAQPLDTDSPEHITWIYDRAQTRAREFGIAGVTPRLVWGVVKHIVPAVASTNAIIAAACCNEVFKVVTGVSEYLRNFMMFNGESGIYTYAFEHEKRDDCLACGSQAETYTAADPKETLADFIRMLSESPSKQLHSPSLRTARNVLYMESPEQLHELTKPNLPRRMDDLVESGEVIFVTDPSLPVSLQIIYNI